MSKVTAEWVQGRAWLAQARGFTVVGDLARAGDPAYEEQGMTPGEMMVASMALCTGVDLSYYAERHPEIDLSHIRLELSSESAEDRPMRFTAIHMRVTLPPGLNEQQIAALTRIANGCKVHNTLERGVTITVSIDET